jgi:long-subunit fatty acid transport protein
LVSDYQDGLDSDFPTPLGIGVGTTVRVSSTQLGTLNLYVSAEWFAGVDKFDVIKTEEFVGQSDGEVYRNEITHELDDVLNFGLGIEHIFNENITLYGSIRTDFSAKKQGSDSTLTVTDWDIYHILAGTTFRLKNTEWTIGFGYSWGSAEKTKEAGLIDPSEDYQYQNILKYVDFRYNSINILFGFSF